MAGVEHHENVLLVIHRIGEVCLDVKTLLVHLATQSRGHRHGPKADSHDS